MLSAAIQLANEQLDMSNQLAFQEAERAFRLRGYLVHKFESKITAHNGMTVADYFPFTENWKVRNTGQTGKGLDSLIATMEDKGNE